MTEQHPNMRKRTGAYLLLFLVLAILGVSGGDIDSEQDKYFFNSSRKVNGVDKPLQDLDLTQVENLILQHGGNRTRRQTHGSIPLLNAQPNTAGTSVESLLASCQLTNLLLYQILQQKQAVVPNAGLLGLGAVQQNLVNPYQETLSTYLSTSTYVTTMTTTALVTIPLLFGNKPVPTTITRTKVYDVTTSEVLTLTTTIKPTPTQTTPDPTLLATSASPSLLDSLEIDDKLNESGQDESRENLKIKNRHLEADEEVPTIKPSRSNSAEFTTKSSKVSNAAEGAKRGGKRRKSTGRQQTAASAPISRPKLKPKDSGGSSRRGSTRDRSTSREPAQYKILRDNRERSRNTQTEAPKYQQEVVTNAPKYSYNQQQEQYTSPRSQPQEQFTSPRGQQQQVQDTQPYYQDEYEQYPYSREVVKTGGQRGRKVPTQNDYVERYTPNYDTQLALDDPDVYAGGNAYDYNNYYARRLKRRGPAAADTAEATELDREYLLEPSFQGDYSQGYEQVDQCPPAVPSVITSTVTETKTTTVTKYMTVTPSIPTATTRYYSDYGESESQPRTTPRSRGRVRYRSSTVPTTKETIKAPEEYYQRRNIYRRDYANA